MPRRSTHYYTSENAKKPEDEKIYIYYCKYSGRHAMTTDINIEVLPRRDTDNAYILDTEEHTVKLYTTGTFQRDSAPRTHSPLRREHYFFSFHPQHFSDRSHFISAFLMMPTQTER